MQGLVGQHCTRYQRGARWAKTAPGTSVEPANLDPGQCTTLLAVWTSQHSWEVETVPTLTAEEQTGWRGEGTSCNHA